MTRTDAADLATHSPESLVALFTKSPTVSNVKTRLAVAIGKSRAHACYRTLLNHTIQCVLPFNSVVYVDGEVDDRSWLQGLPYQPQVNGDLGTRMLACFEDGVKVVVGADCPIMSVSYIQTALEALSQNDVVLGPTEDGGYVLIGMNRPIPELFQNIAWSTEKVLNETMKKARSLDVRVHRLDRVWDVDTVEEYRRWLSSDNLNPPNP